MEYALSTKPLLIDLLVIKKLQGIEIENEIGRRFRSHNVIEYKSPETLPAWAWGTAIIRIKFDLTVCQVNAESMLLESGAPFFDVRLFPV